MVVKYTSRIPVICSVVDLIGGAGKAKSKWWSNVKYAKHPLAAVEPLNVPLQPDLEDVEGMLFVSFVAKEALNIHVDNIKVSETSLPPPPLTLDQSDHHEAEDASLSMEERIAKLEKILLLHLKEQKHRQVIHPRLQDVGMKLSLLDSKLSIDLQYLGVHLPLPSPIHKGLDKMNPMSLSSPECFVSRTGKTNDPTKIKGWRDKFKTNTVQSAPEGLKNSSAFCSEMLDAYLENEAQQISDRVAVFSKCSASPVSYQLPSKSSSYVVTLDSLLKTRSVSSNKVDSKPMNKILCKSSRRRSPSAAVPLSSAGFQNGLQGTQENRRKVARSFEARRHAVPTVQASRSMSFVSRPVTKKQPAKSQLRWSSSAGTRSQMSGVHSVIPEKVKNHMMLQEMEEEAIFHGKVCTHITTARAKFALTSLLNFQKPHKRPRFCMPHKDENTCLEAFCHLGCICDSLDREVRGPTHCRRVECMFDCNCFKHKVLLLHPLPEVKVNVQQGRKRSLMAFSIADPEREPRPPPAPSVPTLWKRTTGEHDPEPLFIPAQPASRLRTSLNVSTSKVQEEDKDPVYLYFESMMTCARVREYNSNPPPQIHMFLTRNEMKELEQTNETVEAGERTSSKNKPETPVIPGEPKPTKLLEILSECNWEPHRNLLLRVLFQRMSSNLLSEPFCFGMYKILLLSTTTKGVGRYATITYKVCISRADKKETTEDLQLPENTTMRRKSLQDFETKVLKTNQTRAQKATADTDSRRKSSASVKKQASLFKRLLSAVPFSTHAAPLGYLTANKKKPGSPAQGLITIKGGTYNQAKLLLGQLGALHPVNRFAAFIVGKLLPRPQDQPKIASDITKACPPKAPRKASSITKVANVSNQTPSNLVVTRSPFAIAPKPNTASKNRLSDISHMNACSNLGPSSGTTPTVPGGSRFIVMPGRPSNFAAALSAETVTSSTLPPGQKVVLHPAPGMPESNFLCQYNGQMIQLMPVSSGPLYQPQPSSVSEGSTSQVMQTTSKTCLPKDTRSLQKSLNSTPLTDVLPKPFPVIAPKVLSLSAKSGMNIANGMPAFNLSLNFPGKPGTFSFRIRPPTVEDKSVGSKQSGKLPEPSVNSSSTLVLPGGFTLTKLLHPVVPAVPANVTSADSHPAGISQNNESTKTFILQGCSPNLEQNCQVSGSIPKPILPETSNCNSVEKATVALSHSSDGFPSESVTKDDPAESVNTATPGKYDWLPEDAEMVHTSDVSDLEPKDMDDWPPSGAERILWMDSADEDENEDSNKELNKDLDVAAGSQAAEEASESKTTTTGTVKADFRNCDECLHGDKLHFNEKLTPEPTHIHENVKEDACSKSSRADEQKHPKRSMPNSDQEKVCDPLLNAANSNTADICPKEPSFSVLIKNGADDNKLSQISVGSPNIRGQVMIQENCPSVLHKNEPDDKPRKTDMAGNEPDIKTQGLVPENSTLCSSKMETSNGQTGENTLLDHFLNKKQRPGSNNDGVSIKIESCSNSPKMDTCSVYDGDAKQHIGSQNILPLINKEPSVTQTVAEFSSDLSKRGLDSNSSQILSHKESYNNPAKHNAVALLHDDGHAPCSLLDGQTPVLNPTSAAQLLNPASLGQKTGLKSISPLPHNMPKSSPDKPLKSTTAVGELCDDEIVVDVVNLSEDEDPSDEFDRSEDNSSEDGEDDINSDEEDSSNGSTSDSDRTGTSDDDEDIDIESVEDNDGKRIVNMMIKDRTRLKKRAKRAAALSKKIKHLSNIISPAGYPPTYELIKRQSHTEKERLRRVEMRQSFALLKEALNVDEQIRLGRHDILNQARIMILALEDRSQRLEARKKALLQRRSAFLSRIVKLAENAGDEASFQENHEQQKQFGSQNTVTSVAAPQVNPRRLDSDGNRLPPRLGRWKAPNYIRKRSKKALHQASITTTEAADENLDSHLSPNTPGSDTVSGPLPSVKTEDLVRTLITQNPTRLPPVHKNPQQKSVLPEPKPTEKRSLPKIVLQSFSKTESVKLARDVRPSQQSSTEVSNADLLSDGAVSELQDDDKGLEKCDATKVSDGMEKTLVSEHANTDNPTPSSALTESDVQNNTMSKLEKDEQASAAVVKVRRRKRARCDVVIEEALSSPDFFGPRQLRQRPTAVNGRAAKRGSANKRRRMI